MAAFLAGNLPFVKIYPLIRETVERAEFIAAPGFDDYVESNAQARRIAADLVACGV